MRAALAPILLEGGIPRKGLIAWHDLYSPNILLQSNTFSTSWTNTRSTDLISASVTAPSGAVATKLVEDNSAGNDHTIAQTIAAVGTTGTLRILAKGDGTRDGVRLHYYNKGWVDVNLLTGAVLSVTGGYSGSSTSAGDGWWDVRLVGDFSSGTTVFAYIYDLVSGVAYDGLGHAAGAGVEADPGIYIADAQLYPSATLPPYTATTTLQSFTDLSGKGNTLTRGSNSTAADSNDPTVSGPGLSFVTDDYCLTGDLSAVSIAGPWTVILAGNVRLDDTLGVVWCMADGTTNTEAQFIGQTSGSAYTLLAASKHTSSVSSSNLVAIPDSPICLVMTNNTETIALTRLDTGTTVTVVDQNPTGVPRVAIGATAYSAPSVAAESIKVYEHLLYNRVLSAAELQRIRKVIKSKWAGRPGGAVIL